MRSRITSNVFLCTKRFGVSIDDLLSTTLASTQLFRHFTSSDVSSEELALAGLTTELVFTREGHFIFDTMPYGDIPLALRCLIK